VAVVQMWLLTQGLYKQPLQDESAKYFFFQVLKQAEEEYIKVMAIEASLESMLQLTIQVIISKFQITFLCYKHTNVCTYGKMFDFTDICL
jgi:hypothetical protein